EAVAEADDDLIAKYLEGEELSEAEVRRALRTALVQGMVAPVLAGSATRNIGIACLLDELVANFPSPADEGAVIAVNAQGDEERLTATADGPLAALVFKTQADPYVGRLTYF